jgi:hypothetical protein
MDAISQATETIRRAEDELRQLLLQAAEQGDYETASMLAEWAKQLKQIVPRSVTPEEQPQFTHVHNGLAPAHFDETNREYTNARKKVAREASRRSRRKAARGEYPKFLRDGEELLKIGWSKRTRATYRHKAPKRVVNLVVHALLGKGKTGARFTMEEVLPIRDPESAIDVPSYQAYLILAWLRKENLVVQHGREGYSLRPQTNLTDAIEERWEVLPNHSGQEESP